VAALDESGSYVRSKPRYQYLDLDVQILMEGEPYFKITIDTMFEGSGASAIMRRTYGA
jgi:hypothetical protein